LYFTDKKVLVEEGRGGGEQEKKRAE